MDRVSSAIQSGKCVIAVGGDLLKDASIRLAISDREGLPFVGLSGTVPAPLVKPTPDAMLRAVAQADGVLVVVEPQPADQAGIQKLGAIAAKANHKPTVVVVSRSFNPLSWMMTFPGMQVVPEKAKAKAFFKKLAKPPADAPELPKVAELKEAAKPKKKSGIKPVFVGRDEELAEVRTELAKPGPLVVHGPMGIGKSSLLEHALHDLDGVTRLPDLTLSWDVGYDAIITRLCGVLASSGHPDFMKQLESPAAPLERVQQLIEALKGADGCTGKAMVIRDLDLVLGQDDHFRHSDRLALLLKELLTNSYPLTLVFTSTRKPVFYLEGQAAELRYYELGGIKGRFFNDIFEAYQAAEVKREWFGPMSEALMGHPMAARTFAAETRLREGGASLAEDIRFLKREHPADDKTLRKRIEKRLEKLDKGLRSALALVAHLGMGVDGAFLSRIGLKRDERIALVGMGLLEQQGPDATRVYRVHRMVRGLMSRRETSDFKIYAELAGEYRRLANKEQDKLTRMVLRQEHNRLALAGRRGRDLLPLPGPDADGILESVRGILAMRNNPRLDIAKARLKDVLKVDPHNSTALVMQAEVIGRESNDGNLINAAFEAAIQAAPIPEVYHALASYRLEKKGGRKKAVGALNAGIERFPEDARMRRRVAGLHLRAGEFAEAETALREAIAKEPMMPDSYGLLGTTLQLVGPERWDDAEQYSREALRLSAGDPVHAARVATLLTERANYGMGNVTALREEARELVDEALKADRVPLDVYLAKASLLCDLQGDIEQTSYLIGKAKKVTTRDPNRRARLDRVRTRHLLWQKKLEEAEKLARDTLKRGRPDHRAVALLAQVLEARGLLVPAHAEYQRAIGMVAHSELFTRSYQSQLNRLQGLIEQQAAEAAVLAGAAPVAEDAPAPAPVDAEAVLAGEAQKVVRRAADGTVTEVTEDDGSNGPTLVAPVPELPEAVPAEAAAEAAPADDETPSVAEVVEAALAAPEEAPAAEAEAAPAEEAPATEPEAPEAPPEA